MARKGRAIILIVMFGLAFSLGVLGAGVEIDGRTNERAWVDAPGTVLVSSGDISNCAVEYAAVTTITDYDNSIVYFSFRAIVDGSIDSTTPHGVSLSINNGEPVRITRDGVSEYDTQLYSFTAALCEYNKTDFCVEAAVGIKQGIDTVYSIRVQFIDGNGDYSNAYSISLPEPPTEETTTAYYAQTTEQQTDYYTESKTTERKTTEKKTTTKKQTTTRKPTSERTTKETTVRETKTAKTTVQRTTAASKTTKSQQETTVKIVTVYVPVTDDVSTVAATQSTSSVTAAATESGTDDGSFKIRKETAYIAVAVLAVVTFGVCVMVNMSYDKNSDRKKQ